MFTTICYFLEFLSLSHFMLAPKSSTWVIVLAIDNIKWQKATNLKPEFIAYFYFAIVLNKKIALTNHIA